MLHWLNDDEDFPPLSAALTSPNGLLAAGGDLSPQRLLNAYRRGVFPWFGKGQPLLWWSPDPRCVLFPDRFKMSRSLRQRIRQGGYQVWADYDFTAVLQACACSRRPNQEGTWIMPAMQHAYTQLHQMGYAHSVETWMNGELVGGLYGVTIGRVFFGESMFFHRRDASKIAFAHLIHHLRRVGYELVDCQINTPHLVSLGAINLPRSTFSEQLATMVVHDDKIPTGRWTPNAAAKAPL